MTTETIIDLTGIRCPMPIVEISKRMKTVDIDDILTFVADDPAFKPDVEAWCRKTGQKLINLEASDEKIVALIQKLV